MLDSSREQDQIALREMMMPHSANSAQV